MDRRLLKGMASLLLPFGAYAHSPQAYGRYDQSYLRSISAPLSSTVIDAKALESIENSAIHSDTNHHTSIELSRPKSELLIIDEAVPDKHLFHSQFRAGIDVYEISSDKDGLAQLVEVLSQYKDLDALHVVSHAADGEIYLGNSTVTEEFLKQEITALAALDRSLKSGADLMLYGCDLAKSEKGEQLLDLIVNSADIDVAASNDLTGNSREGGDWDLEIHKGNIETKQPFSELALKDFSGVLDLTGGNGTIDMTGFANAYAAAPNYTTGDGTTITISSSSSGANDFYRTGGNYMYVVPRGVATDAGIKKAYVYFTNNETFDVSSFYVYNASAAGHTFTISSDQGDSQNSSALASAASETVNLVGFTGINKLTIEYSDNADLDTFRLDDIVLANVTAPTPPSITSATYNASTNALVVTGTDFVAQGGAANDVDTSTITLTGDGGATHTLTGGQTADVEISSATEFTVTIGGTDVAAVEALLDLNGTSSDDSTTYNIAVADDFLPGFTTGDTSDATNAVTVSGWTPSITSSTYDFSNGNLVVTGVYFAANGGGSDIDASTFTITGEDGATYTLTDTSDVEHTNLETFTLDLSATDEAAVNAIINKDGTTSTGGTTYNLAAADDFITNETSGDTSDTAGNGITVSNVPAPTITSATYNGTTGVFVVTGTNIPSFAGVNNDIDASLFTFTGANNSDIGSYTLVGSSDVDRTSATSFSITLDATDKAEIQRRINQAGLTSTGGITYNLAGAEDWSVGADAAVNVVDAAGNGVTVSAVPAPTITSATYSEDTNALVVTGTNFVGLDGAGNDIDATTITFTGEAGGTHTLTAGQTNDVEIDSVTQFTVTVGGTDVASVEALLNVNGTESSDTTTYNLAAADDFNAGITDGDTSDVTNAITVSGWPQPTITSATYDYATGDLVVTGVDIEANAGVTNDITANAFTITGENGDTYTLTDTSNVERDNATQFTLDLSATDEAAVNAIINKNGGTSTGGTTYNLAAADDFVAGVTVGNTQDLAGNAITVSNVPAPTITSATYNGTTGVFVVTGTNIPFITGVNNDIDASLFTFTGANNSDIGSYTLVGSSDVDRTSATSFSITLDATDKAQIQRRINQAGLTSTGGITYNLAGAEDWSVGADAAVNVVDAAGNGVSVSNVPTPTITSATYSEDTKSLVVTGTNFVGLDGATNDIDATTITLTGEAGGTHTLTAGQTNDVEIDTVTQFTITVGGTDVASVEALLNVNGTSSNDSTTYNLAAADDFNAGNTDGDTSDATNAITVSGWPQPTITSANYDAATGTLVVTGTDFTANGGGADVDASAFTFTGEDGTTYTLTDTADVEITNATSFTITLSATDKAAVNAIINKDGGSATGGQTYNIAVADNFMTAVTAGDTSDIAGNAITVSNVSVPTITSATYDISTGNLVVTGTDIPSLTGANNDIDASLFTVTGEGAGGAAYTLTTTSDVERTSATSFTLVLDATDQAGLQEILNKNGLSSTDGTTYNLAAAEDWAVGADAAVNVVDATGNAITVSNVPVPTITSATYDFSTGVLVATGTGLLKLSGATNDIDISTLTLLGEASGTHTITSASDVEITSDTSFSVTLAGGDKTAVDALLHINGTTSDDGTTYNLAAGEDWNTGADAALNTADGTAGVTVSGHPVPSITSSTFDGSTGVLVVTGTNFAANGGGLDVDASTLTLTGEDGDTYQLTDTTDVNRDSVTQFTLTLSATDLAGVNAIFNQNGATSTGGTTYNLAAADDFITGDTLADTSDASATVTVSNRPVPSITSAAYDVTAGTLTVTGTNIPSLTGANTDIDASMFTMTGQAGGTYTLVGTSDVDRTSATEFTLTLDATDKAAVEALFNKAGTESNDATTYNLAAAEDWSTGAAPAVNVVDNTNAVTVSNFPPPPPPPNNAPVIAEGSSLSKEVIESNELTFELNGTDANGDGLTWTSSNTANATITLTDINAGTVTVTYLPNEGFVGNDNFVMSLSDGSVSDSITVQVTVQENSAPVIAEGEALLKEVIEGQELTFSLNGSDANGDGLTWTSSNTENATITLTDINAETVTVLYLPNEGFVGEDSFTISLSDALVSDSIAVQVTVQEDPRVAPVVTVNRLTTNNPSPSLSGTLDSDDTNITISVTVADISYVGVNNGDGTWTLSGNTISPSLADGIYDVSVIATLDHLFGTDSTSNELVIDTIPPEVESTVIDPREIDIADKVMSVNVAGVEAGDSYEFTLTTSTGEIITGEGTFDETGTIAGLDISSLDVTAEWTLVVTVTDLAGNAVTKTISYTVPRGTINASALLTKVSLSQLQDLGLASADDDVNNCSSCSINALGEIRYEPGRHLLDWTLSPAILDVVPQVSLGLDDIIAEGEEGNIGFFLNGHAPEYPYTVNYVVVGADTDPTTTSSGEVTEFGTTDSDDHNLANGAVTFTSDSPTEQSVSFTTVAEDGSEGDETIVITFADGTLNTGVQDQQTITIREENVAPVVSLSASQSEVHGLIFSNELGGSVIVVQSQVTDGNTGDTVSYSWTGSGVRDLDSNDTTFTFSPAGLSAGSYELSLTVTDNGSPVLSNSATIYLSIRDVLPILSASQDSDDDGISDEDEGLSDSDNDGVPDYLDPPLPANIIPSVASEPDVYLIECDPSADCRLGSFAIQGENSGALLSEDEQETLLDDDEGHTNVGGVFDFAGQLPELGDSLRIVIPLRSPIPARAVYRKYTEENGWNDFVEGLGNVVYSTEGDEGSCPPPGDDLWEEGLIEGYRCLQLEIEDGGPNDSDGEANGTVVDPGGVAVRIEEDENIPPVAMSDSAQTNENTEVVINVLINDSDSDGGILSVTEAEADVGSVIIGDDNQLQYTPAEDYVGIATITYTLSDGQGGQDTAFVEVTISEDITDGETGNEEIEDTPRKKSSGGAIGWLFLLMILFGIRRKQY